jgi:hypothetical protein
MRRLFAISTVLLCLAVVTVGCAAKKAATSGEQTLLDVRTDLQAVSAEFRSTSLAYATRCQATPRTITVADCNAFVDFSPTFKRDYEDADAAWNQARARGSGQAAVRQTVAGLKARLKPYTDKTK